MQQPSKIADYLEAVQQQIRWKKAQPPVLEEINNHITDQKNAFIRDGFNEEEATNKAIAEMGDPIVVGEQLDRTHRPRPDWPLLVMVAILLLLGLAIQIVIGPNNFTNGDEMVQKQIRWAGISILVMFAAYFLDFTIIGKYPKVAYFALCAFTVASYLITGGNRGTSTIYLLLLFPTAFAGFVYSVGSKGYRGLILCGIAFIIPAYLSMLVPNVTILFLICTSYLTIMTVAVEKGWFNVRKRFAILTMYSSTAAVLSTLFVMKMGDGYFMRRMQMIFNPSLDPTGTGYIGSMIQRLLAHSQFIGEGLPIRGYGEYSGLTLLPAVNSDFLLTYLIYRFGWIVLIGIIVIFAVFITRAILLCKKQKGILGFLVSLAIISTFAVQCMVFIAFDLGLLLLSPVSLPFLSYGGRALVTNMFLIGLLLSVFRTVNLVGDKAGAGVAVAKSSHFLQYDNGKIIINLKAHFIK